MAKPRKKYRPRYSREQMLCAWKDAIFPRSAEEVDSSEAAKIKAELTNAFDALRDGRATWFDMTKLAVAANHAMVLCELGVGAEWFGVVVKAQEWLAKAEYHFHDHGEFRVETGGLVAIIEMIDVRIAQLSADGYTSGIDYRAAQIVHERAKQKHVITRDDLEQPAKVVDMEAA